MSDPSYRSIAKFYDVFDRIFLLDDKGNPRIGLLEAIPDAPLRVLDVCSGTAASALRLAIHNPHNQIVGIDISPQMLAVARRKVQAAGVTNLELQAMSADALRFADGSFDAVMVSFALHEMDAGLRRRIFAEIERVLKPGAPLYVIDFARQPGWRNRWFIGLWGCFEPACFAAFLELDWTAGLNNGGLVFERSHSYAFSNLYVLRKRRQGSL